MILVQLILLTLQDKFLVLFKITGNEHFWIEIFSSVVMVKRLNITKITSNTYERVHLAIIKIAYPLAKMH